MAKFKGILAEPMPPLQLGILMPKDRADALIRERGDEEFRRMQMLSAFYGIKPGPNQWFFLALAMARETVPGLQEKKAAGRPTKWSLYALGLLFVEVERLREKGLSLSTANTLLANQQPWKKFVESWDPGMAYGGPDAAAALATAYKKAKRSKLSPIMHKAYLWHVYEGSVDEWDAEVARLDADNERNKSRTG